MTRVNGLLCLARYSVNCGTVKTCQVCHVEDARREKVLREMGLKIVRFKNEEVLRNLCAVVGKIRKLVLIQQA